MIKETSHRPWPIPNARWVLSMRWHDLLFLHWPVHPEVIRPLIPSVLELDVFDGWCWIGVVPFRMSGVRPRYMPTPLAFPELNVRTYVKMPGRSGVWFFSLDAASWLAVRSACWLGLPYYNARMTMELAGETVIFPLQKRPRPYGSSTRRIQRILSSDWTGLPRGVGYAGSLAH